MKNMRDKNSTNSGFTCVHCGREVPPAATTARNHCPFCLWSLHVDESVPGDRQSSCHGQMEPAAIFQKRTGWVVIHRCEKCGKEISNKCAADDNFETLLNLTTLQK
ncbi:MAG: RNHCP domain-containing protein [Candidatus Peribacteraceae bacterium]|nr:RNHCP domain-containing protein [Candidatus Peribacteraceae bacterium]